MMIFIYRLIFRKYFVVIDANTTFARLDRGVAQSGSVLVWGARGRKFKSCHPDKPKKPSRNSGEASLFLRRPGAA